MPDKNIPEVLSNFRVYAEAADMLGIADVELPTLEAMTADVMGAGVAGKIETPIVGHYDSMQVGLTWRTVTQNVYTLAAPIAHQLDLRGSIQVYDPASGEHDNVPCKVVVKSMPKSTELGKLEVGEQMDTKTEFEIFYIKITHGEDEVLEIDKLNFICKIGDTDYLEKVRTNLGL
jgi:P2 family phage contractile tail tube protein